MWACSKAAKTEQQDKSVQDTGTNKLVEKDTKLEEINLSTMLSKTTATW